MCPICAEKTKLDFAIIASIAADNFWSTVVASFPTLRTETISENTTNRLKDIMKEAIQEWYTINSKLPDPPAEIILSPYKEFKELNLHFGKEWELELVSNNCYIAYILFYDLDGDARRLGVSSRRITIIDKPWTAEQVESYTWLFGDNPTAFFCAMDDFVVHCEQFDVGKLFDDCQTIAKSGLV